MNKHTYAAILLQGILLFQNNQNQWKYESLAILHSSIYWYESHNGKTHNFNFKRILGQLLTFSPWTSSTFYFFKICHHCLTTENIHFIKTKSFTAQKSHFTTFFFFFEAFRLCSIVSQKYCFLTFFWREMR